LTVFSVAYNPDIKGAAQMTIQDIFEKFDGPWAVFELDAQSKALRESGRIYGVKNKRERPVADYITLDEANVIAAAPELLALVYDIVDDDDNSLSPHYKKQAKLLLEMVRGT
jgi:hypothetical protein